MRRHLSMNVVNQPFRPRVLLQFLVLLICLVVAAGSQSLGAGPVSEPTQAPLSAATSPSEIEIDRDTTWRRLFDQLAASEQDCIRIQVGDSLEAVLSETVVETDVNEPEAWLEQIIGCLPEETVRSISIAIVVAHWLDSMGLALSHQEETCLRNSLVDGDTELGMVTCVSDLFSAITETATAAVDRDATRTQATALTDGQAAVGRLDRMKDIDVFTFQALEETHYRLVAELDTLRSALLLLVNSDGRVLASFSVYEYSGASTEIWLAQSSDDYFVAVLGPYSQTGSYSLKVAEVVDDHPDHTNGAATIAIGEAVEGNVDHYEDRDVFAFQVEEGVFYLLDVELGTLGDSRLEVQDVEGVPLAENDDRYRGEFASRIVWKASVSEPVFAVVSGGRSKIGTYTLTISPIVDDHVERRHGSTVISLGEPVSGALNYERDLDVFAFGAEEGVIYDLAVASDALVKPVFGVIGRGEDYLAGNIGHRDYWTPQFQWKAPATETYYVALSGEGTGSYTLSVAATDLVDRHADTISAAAAAALGESVTGAIEHVHDEDLFAFEAREGVIYEITVGSGTLSEPVFKVVGADKQSLASNASFPQLRKTQVLWQAPTTDRFYVAVTAQGTGTYRLRVSETPLVDIHGNDTFQASAAMVGKAVPAGIDHAHDKDVFVLNASEGVIYEATLSLQSLENATMYVADAEDDVVARLDFGDDPGTKRIIWKSPAAGAYYVVVDSRNTGTYTLTVRRSTVVDDHSDTPSGATRVREGRIVEGEVDYEGDADVFVFKAKEGELYDIDVDLGTLGDGVMTVEDGDGVVLEWNTGNSYGGEPRAFWRAPATGDYYVQIGRSGYSSRPGTFTLSVSRVVDDHGGSASLATAIVVGESVEGSIDQPWDRDWFVFEGKANTLYKIEASLGTLPGASLFLEDSNDDWLASNDEAHGQPPSIVFLAASSGEYYVAVSNSGFPGMGTYALTVSAVQVDDDHGNRRQGATPLSVGESVEGSVDYVEDVDVFAFEVIAGGRYEIKVTRGTLSECTFYLWRGSGGIATRERIGEDSRSALVSWTAPVSGTYYVSVHGSFFRVGTYTLTVTDSPEAEATPVQ